MGTPDFAVPALRAINERTVHTVAALYTQPPRPKGRGQRVQKSPTHIYADTRDIPVHTPKSLKTTDDQAVFAAHNADIAVVAAYGLILPQIVLDAPKYGCVNIHASLLPRWRGASPIQQAIWHGDARSGVSIMQMELGLDTGPVIMDASTPITGATTATALHDALSDMGADLIIKTLNDLADILAPQTRLPAAAQDDAHTTYAPLLTKADGAVDWTQDARAIDRQIRALTPWPSVYTHIQARRFKIVAAAPAYDADTAHNARTGTILNRKGDVACGGGGALRITTIQPHGKKAMDFAGAINGGHISVGDVFA